MRNSFFLINVLLLLLPLAMRAQEGEGTPIDGVIAVVADEIILRSELEEQFTQFARSGMTVEEDTRCVLLEDLLSQKLLIHQAGVDSVEVDEAQVESELNRRIEYFVSQIGSVEKLEEFYGKSLVKIKSEFHDLIRDQMLVQQMQGEITGSVSVSPKEVRDFYHAIPKDSLPYINSEVEVAHIVLDPQVSDAEKESTRKRLREIRDRILNGEDFGTLAYLYSEDPGSARQNGELGFLTRGMLVKEFAAEAFSLEPGQVSGIVETEFGFHLIEVVEKKGQEVNARHILLKPKISTSDLVRSKAILDSLKQVLLANDTVSFDELAEKYSTDKPTKMNGGRLINPQTGETRFETDQMNQVDPGLFFVLDKMKPGEVSDPVVYQKPDGSKAYRLVKLLSVTEPHRANLKDDYQRIQAAAKADKQANIMREWMEDHIRRSYIKLSDEYRECTFENKWF
jgi:peptidyl-prolyl cis-trans isomerase SurA